MEIIQKGNPAKGQRTPFSWREICRCGTVLSVTARDVDGPRDIHGRLHVRPYRPLNVRCPICSNKIQVEDWKAAGQ